MKKSKKTKKYQVTNENTTSTSVKSFCESFYSFSLQLITYNLNLLLLLTMFSWSDPSQAQTPKLSGTQKATLTLPGETQNHASANIANHATLGGTANNNWFWNSYLTNNSGYANYEGVNTVQANNGKVSMNSVSFQISPLPAITVSFSNETVKCNGASSGKITAIVKGGKPPYQYNWSNGAAGNPATGLFAGTYIVTVTDANGCARSQTTILTENPPLMVAINQSGPDAAMANAAGGVPLYTYSWNTIPVQTTPVATGLLPGQTYFLTVTDNKLCSRLTEFKINSMRWIMPEKETTFRVCAFPNPARSILQIQMENSARRNCLFEMFDISGRLVYQKERMLEESEIHNINVNLFSTGIYTLKVTSGHNFEIIKIDIE